MSDDCKGSWDLSKWSGKGYCPVHKLFFDTTCPKYSLQNILVPTASRGNTDMFREGHGFEQGIEQGVTSLTRKGDKHSHAFRFVVLLPDLPDWSSRNKVLESKGFDAVSKGGIGRIFMSNWFGLS